MIELTATAFMIWDVLRRSVTGKISFCSTGAFTGSPNSSISTTLPVEANPSSSLGLYPCISITILIAFLFWSIVAGIVLAAGMIPLAVFGSVFIGLIILIFANRKDMTNPYIVVLTCADHASEEAAAAFLKEHTKRCVVKSKTARKGMVELNLEVRLESDDTDFINQLSDMEGIESAVLVSYNGDYMG